MRYFFITNKIHSPFSFELVAFGAIFFHLFSIPISRLRLLFTRNICRVRNENVTNAFLMAKGHRKFLLFIFAVCFRWVSERDGIELLNHKKMMMMMICMLRFSVHHFHRDSRESNQHFIYATVGEEMLYFKFFRNRDEWIFQCKLALWFSIKVMTNRFLI